MTKQTIKSVQNAFQTAAIKDSEPKPMGNSKFLNIGDATELQLALLPDANEDNPNYFAVEVFKHKAIINGERTSIPCLKQFKDENGMAYDCPACKVSAAYYTVADKANGSKMYRKVEHIVNVKVVADNSPVNPETGVNQLGKIGQMRLTYQTWNALTTGLSDPELSDVDFTDLKTALPFIVRKTEQGGFPNYSTSGFGRKPIKMSDADIAECKESIKDLSDFLPVQPTEEAMDAWTAAAQGQLSGDVIANTKAVSDMTAEEKVKNADEVMAKIRSRQEANRK